MEPGSQDAGGWGEQKENSFQESTGSYLMLLMSQKRGRSVMSEFFSLHLNTYLSVCAEDMSVNVSITQASVLL